MSYASLFVGREKSVRCGSLCDIYYSSTVCLTGSGTISIHAERLQISDATQEQNESI